MKHKRKYKATSPADEFEKTAVKVSLVSIIGNTVLSLFKIMAGVFAHSGAMISDAVHSASDVLSSIIVIIGVKISAKGSDKDHPYGHERFECVAAIVLAVILLISGLFIGHTAVEKIQAGNVQQIAIPGILALVAAIVSIASKEAMYWYTRFYALHLDSGALMADAWHHRSDALSSIGALIGIVGARMGLPMLDTVASLVICFFIIKAAYDIFKDAISKMVDRSCSEETQKDILQCALEQDGVCGIDSIQTRVFGNKIYVDIAIFANNAITLARSHQIARQVHDALEDKFKKIKHITVCVNPLQNECIEENAGENRKKIAFICVHNSCRSQIAEALGKYLREDDFDFYSAGTETKQRINQDAVRLMKQLYGIDMEQAQYSKTFDKIPAPDIAISMGCDVSCPFIGRAFDNNWDLPDPTGQSDEVFSEVIRQIEQKIQSM